MLYLKGAQGRRFISDESQRKDLYDRLQLETRSQNTNPITLSEAAELFLNSLRKAQEAEEETNDHPGYLTDNLLNWFSLVTISSKCSSSGLKGGVCLQGERKGWE
ncbi:proline-serine-threonine phosphatase-interacting protein 1 [Platysternon megacephalum]|uniref:Proline-serine-threonine phosphatase-interacting protein 1 n=1 Tax=Platysternon megacephalum TaxID=55544 RepID=A0A4D9E3U6_9SAUR|nr:proline-serine-threonine phosphatase-interacting protein 1 [Platysternon megacephalum]